MTSEKLDFDDYCDGIRIATVTYLKAGPTIGHWSLSWSQLPRIALQYGTDGAGRIAHGLTAPNVTTIFIQLTHFPDAVLLDGHMAKWHDIAVLPPATHFTFVSDRHLSWVAVAVPTDTNESTPPEMRNSAHLLREKALITLSPPAAERFIEIGNAMRVELAKSPDQEAVAVIESNFLNTLDGLLNQIDGKVLLPSDYNKSAERIVFRALEYARARPWELVTVEDLVAATRVEYRTLLRAFQRFLKVGPKHYLKLRQLDLVRLALRQKHPANNGESVTSIMVKYGVTEFGRFAVEYKNLFHEMPSETFGKTSDNGKKLP